MVSNDEYLKQTITELSKPLDYKWKLQSYTKDKTKAMCVAYIDARMVIQRLNEVCTYGWHRSHFAIGNDTYCNVGLIMPDGTTIWRSDVGESENDTERAKTSASDSFKRAAVQFGLGLFLYDLEVIKLPVKKDGDFLNIVDDEGNKVWDLTKHINAMLKSGKKPKQSKTTAPKSPGETPKSKEELTPNHKSWSAVKKRVADGVPFEEIEKYFNISEENKKLLQ